MNTKEILLNAAQVLRKTAEHVGVTRYGLSGELTTQAELLEIEAGKIVNPLDTGNKS